MENTEVEVEVVADMKASTHFARNMPTIIPRKIFSNPAVLFSTTWVCIYSGQCNRKAGGKSVPFHLFLHVILSCRPSVCSERGFCIHSYKALFRQDTKNVWNYLIFSENISQSIFRVPFPICHRSIFFPILRGLRFVRHYTSVTRDPNVQKSVPFSHVPKAEANCSSPSRF